MGTGQSVPGHVVVEETEHQTEQSPNQRFMEDRTALEMTQELRSVT